MIKIDVAEYCQHDCLDFCPEVKEPERMDYMDVNNYKVHTEFTDTIVSCKHRSRCEAIRRYLERQAKKDG